MPSTISIMVGGVTLFAVLILFGGFLIGCRWYLRDKLD